MSSKGFAIMGSLNHSSESPVRMVMLEMGMDAILNAYWRSVGTARNKLENNVITIRPERTETLAIQTVF